MRRENGAALRRVFETNFFGTLRLANAFAPAAGRPWRRDAAKRLVGRGLDQRSDRLRSLEGGDVVGDQRVAVELRGQGTQVIGLLVGMVDTPMSARWDMPKVSAASVVTEAYDGVAVGALEVLADEPPRELKCQLGTRAEELYPWLDDVIGSFVA